MPAPRVLFVDDEPNVLDGIRRQLRKHVEVHTASSGAEGLGLLEQGEKFDLIVSDMRMPGMNGAEFLAEVRALAPDTVRMILSGQADLEATIGAINQGHIFRFITKPCSGDDLRKAVAAGLAQYRLITAERELLENTLHGMVETLTDILGLTNPVARQRAMRVRQFVTEIAAGLGFEVPWDLRLATLLSQLGCVTLPQDLLDRLYSGEPLSDEERQLYGRHPEVAARLIQRIPRLGSVSRMIGRQQTTVDFASLPADPLAWDRETLASALLAVAVTLDERLAVGDQPATALRRLQDSLPGMPPMLFQATQRLHLHSAYMDVSFLYVRDLVPGMVLDEDILASDGQRLLARGEEITKSSLDHTLAAAAEPVRNQRVRVLIPA
jgi:response regulator RpfG family c-di-GMP phosphodiesterase